MTEGARDAEACFRALFESVNDAVTLLTPEGIIIEANHRWEVILGLTPEQMAGRHVREFAAAGHEDETADDYARTVASHGQSPVAALRHAGGRPVYMQFSTSHVESGGRPLVLAIGRDITETVLAQRRLEESDAKYRSLIDRIPEVVWSGTLDGKITFMSANIVKLSGYTAREVMKGGRQFWVERVHPADVEQMTENLRAVAAGSRAMDHEYRWLCKDGRWRWFHGRGVVTRGEDGAETLHGLLSDITARKELEEQFWQAQKMEAVGQLTGGVAHDFNNILAAILGNAHFLIENLAESDPRRADAEEIRRAADRASALVRQLLAFSRRQVLQPAVLDLNAVVIGVQSMLRRVMGENIRLEVVAAGDLGAVQADVGQVEQVLMNLVVNARDAMPGGGALTIETANVELDGADVTGDARATPGKYVMVSVSDTGCGMDDETKRHVFEPFFTTKDKSRGTGLGLSTCYGIVEQSGGFMRVHSAPGRGSAFRVYLPRVDAQPRPAAPRRDLAWELGGTETILVVDDDASVRAMVHRILSNLGYHVLLARDAHDAFAITRLREEPVNLVLSDVVMPGASGLELVERLRGPFEAKSLLMSGYTDRAPGAGADGLAGNSFIQKPFAPDALAKKVREILDAR